MPMSFTNYGENKFIDLYFRGQASGLPTIWYLGFSTATPTEAGVVVEPTTGGWYARQAMDRDLQTWAGTQGAGTTTASNGSSGQTSNNELVNFPNPTVGGAQISHWFLADQVSGGNVWFYGEITDDAGTPITITLNVGQALFFDPGQFRIVAP